MLALAHFLWENYNNNKQKHSDILHNIDSDNEHDSEDEDHYRSLSADGGYYDDGLFNDEDDVFEDALDGINEDDEDDDDDDDDEDDSMVDRSMLPYGTSPPAFGSYQRRPTRAITRSVKESVSLGNSPVPPPSFNPKQPTLAVPSSTSMYSNSNSHARSKKATVGANSPLEPAVSITGRVRSESLLAQRANKNSGNSNSGNGQQTPATSAAPPVSGGIIGGVPLSRSKSIDSNNPARNVNMVRKNKQKHKAVSRGHDRKMKTPPLQDEDYTHHDLASNILLSKGSVAAMASPSVSSQHRPILRGLTNGSSSTTSGSSGTVTPNGLVSPPLYYQQQIPSSPPESPALQLEKFHKVLSNFEVDLKSTSQQLRLRLTGFKANETKDSGRIDPSPLWLELRAALNDRTLEQEEEFLAAARTKVDAVFEDVCKFCAPEKASDEIIDVIVGKLLNRVAEVEDYFRNHKAFSQSTEGYKTVYERIDVLRVWHTMYNLIEGHKKVITNWVQPIDGKNICRKSLDNFLMRELRNLSMTVVFQQRRFKRAGIIIDLGLRNLLDPMIHSGLLQMRLPSWAQRLFDLSMMCAAIITAYLRIKNDRKPSAETKLSLNETTEMVRDMHESLNLSAMAHNKRDH